VIGELFYRGNHGRVVEIAAAVGTDGVEQLLRDSRIGKAYTQFSRDLESDVLILLVETNPETRFKGPLQHPLSMDFEDFALGKTTEESLSYLDWISARF
jgi:hypothetical protein